mmetsp:Transcript_31135/g.70967  ORF Transcript_31135/g.70967 Transcript_31135/m.70967 type:complete len:304 (+) Transcript_31135:59-970(+)
MFRLLLLPVVCGVVLSPLKGRNKPQCGSTHPDGRAVGNFSDGRNDRCYSVVTPADAPRPMPVVFWFHGAKGNAKDCGVSGPGSEMGALAVKYGFALVCGEGVQGIFGPGGQWDIPNIITDTTGTPCKPEDSTEIVYFNEILKSLSAHPEHYDVNRLYFSGCSMGAGMSQYLGVCTKKSAPSAVSAFATHSTGLKIKNDGLMWRPDNHQPQYFWSECPRCKYYPQKVVKYDDPVGLKACVFDNKQDPDDKDPFFYKSSVQLAEAWEAVGNRVETHWGQGGHCEFESFDAVVQCLDDGTGELARK